ncbi:MAG: hypothetical protein JWL90_2380 [Chthoniobacteraceae bacterium]|nr:hypothetical protein [Chthoniobacteraceae bacterium]
MLINLDLHKSVHSINIMFCPNFSFLRGVSDNCLLLRLFLLFFIGFCTVSPLPVSAQSPHLIVEQPIGTPQPGGGPVVVWGFGSDSGAIPPGGLTEVKMIASGIYHALALRNDGTVVAWGESANGQTAVPQGLSDVQAIGAGEAHSVALKSDGTVVAWGHNAYGQSTVPAGLTGVQAIAAGGRHTVALKLDGTVVAWGLNSDGQTAVPAGLTGVKAIAAGGAHTLALKNDGTLVAWGAGLYGQTNVLGLSDVRAIAAGNKFTLALRTTGTVAARGEMTVPAGIAGIKSIAAGLYHVVALRNDGGIVTWSADGSILTNVPAGLKNVQAVAAGGSQSLALTTNSAAVDFGVQNLRIASEPKVFTLKNTGTTPLQITDVYTKTGNFVYFPDFHVDTEGMSSSVPAGGQTTLRVIFTPSAFGKRSASLYISSNDTAGYNLTLTGEGVDTLAPLISEHANVGPIEATSSLGANVAYAPAEVMDNFTTPLTVTYSQNSDTLFPIGVTTVTITAKDAQNNTATKTFTVTVVGSPRLVIEQPARLSVTGRVVAWGSNDDGQSSVPPGLVAVKSIAAGESFTAALRSDGAVIAWGEDQYGQLNVPAGLKGVQSIATGAAHTLALKSDGTVVAWGSNSSNQATVPNGLIDVQAIAAGANHNLALRHNGTVVEWGTPNPLGYTWMPEGLDHVKAIATAGHSVVLKTNGTVVAWGYSPYGQAIVPSGLRDVQAIAAGGDHTLALKSDGTVVAWGSNLYGQTSVPAGLTGVRAIAAGRNHSLALKNDGTVVAWGYNADGQTDVSNAAIGVQAIAAGFGHSVALVRGTPAVEFSDGSGIVVKTFVLKNNGSVALNLADVTVAGANPGDFKVGVGGLPLVIPAGGETALNVTFTPGGKGRRAAILRVNSDDPFAPIYAIALSGDGIDATVPIITAHANIGPIEATSAAGAVVTYSAVVATDDSGKTPALAYSRESGSIFPIGLTSVIVSATDDAENVSTSTFTVAVTDTTAPNLTLPAERRVLAESALGSTVTFTPAATDVADPEPVILSVPASGSRFPIGTTTVQVTATDKSGNVTHGSFKVTVRDEVPPELIVIHPAANGKFAGDGLLFSGQAKDDRAVERVEIVLNGGAPQVVRPSGMSSSFEWTLSVRPEPGLNTAVVTAYDLFGNPSTSVTRTFNFALMRPAFAGNYNGLFKPTEASVRSIDHQGLLGITVLPTGTFTGKVTLCGTVFPISGVFRNDGSARFGKSGTATLELSKKELSIGQLALALDTTPGAERIAGTLSKDGSVVSLLEHADRAIYTAKKNPDAPFINVPVSLLDPRTDKGFYTALFLASDAPNNGVSVFPQGDGWAKVSVSAGGAVRITGKLADGSPVSCSNLLSRANELPLFLLLYSNSGLLTGTLRFDPTREESDANGAGFKWYKRANASDTLYPAGWPEGINLGMVASKFVKPLANSDLNVFGVAGKTAPVINGEVTLSNGLLAAPLSSDLSIALNSKVTVVNTSGDRTGGPKIVINPAVGSVTGSFTHPGGGKAVSLSGVIYQKSHSAGGFFLFFPPKTAASSLGESGSMSIQAEP